MDAAITSNLLNLGGSAAAPSIGAVPPARPLSDEVSRFASMLGQPERAAAVAPAGTAVAAPSSAVPRVSLGDQILDRIQSAGVRYETMSRSVVTSLQSTQEHVGVRDMLRLQFGISEISLQLELYSKGVGKLLQHVDQLTKLQ